MRTVLADGTIIMVSRSEIVSIYRHKKRNRRNLRVHRPREKLFQKLFEEAILMMELPRRHAASLERAAGSHPIRVQSMGGGRGRDRAQMTYSSSGLLSGSVWQMRRLWLAAHQTPPACASIP